MCLKLKWKNIQYHLLWLIQLKEVMGWVVSKIFFKDKLTHLLFYIK